MAVSLWHCLHGSWHVSQTMIGTYEDGAMPTATANVMEFASEDHLELKCRGAAT